MEWGSRGKEMGFRPLDNRNRTTESSLAVDKPTVAGFESRQSCSAGIEIMKAKKNFTLFCSVCLFFSSRIFYFGWLFSRSENVVIIVSVSWRVPTPQVARTTNLTLLEATKETPFQLSAQIQLPNSNKKIMPYIHPSVIFPIYVQTTRSFFIHAAPCPPGLAYISLVIHGNHNIYTVTPTLVDTLMPQP